jgi:hypothetical protein
MEALDRRGQKQSFQPGSGLIGDRLTPLTNRFESNIIVWPGK